MEGFMRLALEDALLARREWAPPREGGAVLVNPTNQQVGGGHVGERCA
jgi:hypothetical protein